MGCDVPYWLERRQNTLYRCGNIPGFKTLRGSPKGKAQKDNIYLLAMGLGQKRKSEDNIWWTWAKRESQRGQYLLAMNLDLDRYIRCHGHACSGRVAYDCMLVPSSFTYFYVSLFIIVS